MLFCTKCGKQLEDGAKFCPACGTSVTAGNAQPQSAPQTQGQQTEQANQQPRTPGSTPGFQQTQFNFAGSTSSIMTDKTSDFSAEEIKNGRGLALVSYLGLVVLVPLLMHDGNRFVKFHANQGLVIFLGEFISSLMFAIFVWIPVVRVIYGVFYYIFNILLLVLVVMGIVHCVQGKAVELPVAGKIKIFK